MLISKDFKFEAAHHLNNYEGKCANIHGHSYFGTVWIKGPITSPGFVLDYNTIKEIIDQYDHRDLNALADFKEINPTAENIAQTICNNLTNRIGLKYSVAVKLHETASSSAFISNDVELDYLAK